MVFVLAQMFVQQVEERVDESHYFLAGETRREQLGELGAATQLQKHRQGLAVKFLAQAKTHFVGIKAHDRLR